MESSSYAIGGGKENTLAKNAKGKKSSKPAKQTKAAAPKMKAPAKAPAPKVEKKPAKAAPPSKPPAKAAPEVKAPVDAKGKAAAAKPAPVPSAPPAKGKAAAAAPAASAPRTKESTKSDRSLPTPQMSAPRKDGWMGPLPDKAMPRATKLPPEAEAMNKREMEQALTVGTRGLVGEGSLKGRLIVYQGFPYLEVIGRDKRELWFLLQGPDQEVLPAYAEHRVSVSGLIRRTHNYGGSVEVRRYSAKKPDAAPVEVAPVENKQRFLMPGEVEMMAATGMGVGVRGVASLRGTLEMSGDEFFLVLSNPGTRHQVTFTLEGKGAKGLKKSLGEIMVVTGLVEKQSAWGGRIEVENAEPRAPDYPPVARESIEVASVEASGTGAQKELDVKINNGLSVTLSEKQGFVWSIEPQTAKRVSLREVHVKYPSSGATTREFFFTPRNPGLQEIEFFLAKALNPMQVARTFKVVANVKVPEGMVQ